MAQHKSALKRIRSSSTRRLRNRQYRKKYSTIVKSIREAKTKAEGEKLLSAATPYIDQAASKKIIHRNKAGREKSRLTKFVSKLA
jgi:small subunit ribosomal protein S20